jgi:hypothetical protein
MKRCLLALTFGAVAILPAKLVGQDDSMIAAGEAPSFHCDTAGAVDRVVAVVCDSPILASQVEEEIFQQRGQQGAIPKTLPAFRALCRQVISDLIDAEVMVQVASRDTISRSPIRRSPTVWNSNSATCASDSPQRSTSAMS